MWVLRVFQAEGTLGTELLRQMYSQVFEGWQEGQGGWRRMGMREIDRR